MFKIRYYSVLILVAAAIIGFFVWHEQSAPGRFPFRLGLDLSGGTELQYVADVSKLPSANIDSSLSILQQVIEKRVNAFGVGEPVVETERGGALGGGDYRLVVELPGITDVTKAEQMIGATPTLDFKLVKKGMENSVTIATTSAGQVTQIPNPAAFTDTGLTGAYLTGSTVVFGNGSSALASQPEVEVTFNSEGTKLFSQITGGNVGSELAIFLDGNLLSTPVIQEKIPNGQALISGNFTADQAKQLADSLNLGALPVPITLASTETVGATLGAEALHEGIIAGLIGFALVALFMILWYRLPGVVAVAALFIYLVLMMVLFELIPVVLTAAGIAGFILSVGLAVDANILIAERIKEEILAGKSPRAAIATGFSRAWAAIRDSNIAHIIAAIILFWIGTSIIRGFALVFGLGVIVSMLSAVAISRTFLLALGVDTKKARGRFWMLSGLNK
ncbi:MAG: protein translocase subunit SecD [Minisyncoccia bacterium]